MGLEWSRKSRMTDTEKAPNMRGFHLGACERNGDNDPASDRCNPNCPRHLHAEVARLHDLAYLTVKMPSFLRRGNQ